jgi:hypothetical protein
VNDHNHVQPGVSSALDDVVTWLRTMRPTATVGSRAPGAYGMKHTVERLLRRYVSEDELIEAAHIAGYPVDGPPRTGARVGVFRRDYDTQWKASIR